MSSRSRRPPPGLGSRRRSPARMSPTSCSGCARSRRTPSSANAEVKRAAAVPSPRIHRDDAEAVAAGRERTGVEAETYLHGAGLAAIGLHDVGASGLEARAET